MEQDTPLRYVIAHARRLYHHVLNGGTLKASDMALIISALEKLDDETRRR